MQDLTDKYADIAVMCPSSMSSSNTMSDNPELAMTAPGSTAINDKPDRLDNLPLPKASEGQIPLSNSPDSPRPQPSPHPGPGADTFTPPGKVTRPWKDSETNG